MLIYIKDSIEKAIEVDGAIIAHVVNNQGGWGAGISGVISTMDKAPEKYYRAWHQLRNYDADDIAAIVSNPEMFPMFKMGQIQIVKSETATYVNMLAQNGYKTPDNPHPLSLNALTSCLLKLCKFAKDTNSTIHIPKIGAGLGGGDWEEISGIIDNVADASGVRIYIYDYQPNK